MVWLTTAVCRHSFQCSIVKADFLGRVRKVSTTSKITDRPRHREELLVVTILVRPPHFRSSHDPRLEGPRGLPLKVLMRVHRDYQRNVDCAAGQVLLTKMVVLC